MDICQPGTCVFSWFLSWQTPRPILAWMLLLLVDQRAKPVCCLFSSRRWVFCLDKGVLLPLTPWIQSHKILQNGNLTEAPAVLLQFQTSCCGDCCCILIRGENTCFNLIYVIPPKSTFIPSLLGCTYLFAYLLCLQGALQWGIPTDLASILPEMVSKSIYINRKPSF